MPSLNVQGGDVTYDESTREGLNYMLSLSYEEAKTMFQKSDISGFVNFDYSSAGYKLSSNGGSMYTLSKRY